MINTIKALYSTGDFDKTRALLVQALKKYDSLADNELSFIAGMLLNLNETDKALTVLKEEIPPEKLDNESEESLKRQIYLAQIKIRMHSVNIGRRISNNVLAVVEKKVASFSPIALQAICNIAASNFRVIEDYEAIIKIEEYYPYPETLSVRDYFFKIEVFRAKVFLDKKNAKELIASFRSIFQNAPQNKILNYLITMHEFEMKLIEGCLSMEECYSIEARLNQDQTLPTHQAYHYYTVGHAKILTNDTESAISYFQKALSISQCALEKHCITFWLYKFAPNKVPLTDLILLKCSALCSVESYLSGNRYANYIPHELSPYLQVVEKEAITPQRNDCWVITQKELTLKNYLKIEPLDNCIDLYSGIIIENGEVSKILTDLRTKLIRVIYGSGSLGAHVSYLIDTIFDGTYYFYESPHLRLKNLISEITKLGISIIRNKNVYYYDFDKNNFNVIFPCDHSFRGPLIFLAKSHQSINRKIIENKLHVKPSTASAYLKKWREIGYIKKDESNKYGDFLVTDNCLEISA